MATKVLTYRTVRRAMGPAAVDLLAEVDARSRITASVLRRGFFGRLKWLLFGR